MIIRKFTPSGLEEIICLSRRLRIPSCLLLLDIRSMRVGRGGRVLSSLLVLCIAAVVRVAHEQLLYLLFP